MSAPIEDTYAEAFRSLFAEVLVTARDKTWLDHACANATGHASSTILCDCEAGVASFVDPADTPDGRPGAVLQFHVPRFRKDREEALYQSLLKRVSQNVLTCPTASAFSPMAEDIAAGRSIPLGRKIAYFGDGHEFEAERLGRAVWVIPILGGEFVMDRNFGFRDGVMGGNLWFLGESADAALDAGAAAVAAVSKCDGVIAPFPGGLAGSASKAGSNYKFLIASTFAEWCPTLKDKLGEKSLVPDGVKSIQEIIINGRDLESVAAATYAAIDAAKETPGLRLIRAGNYNGRLGKSFIPLIEGSTPWETGS
ncbi:formylmethanofuran--tetrahydromethanopterin N-formyltransferase [Alienimonas chondri]|uniref:Formyltransferase/hydrolase complex subunit D n=1 Tax=Alienimonas chondri TaxID=2681879 RepID=A0ABX1VAS3_9PLAN|nr:formylmethanofuran--tetrahydromethanopterin N-formyltransferase [Alienimonas chondri]NNJ25195.1 Formyltransferase/hydrolase complex subunit D [Alienimonas chondri]